MKLYAITLGLTLAVQFVRAENIGTEIDRLTAYGEGWWKELDAVTSLYERVRSDLLQEKDAEKRSKLAERVFDWALALPTGWDSLENGDRLADEQILFLIRTMDIPPLSTSREIALRHAILFGRFSEQAETLRKVADEMRKVPHERDELYRVKHKRSTYKYAAYFGCWRWYASGRAAKLGESLTVEECEAFARQFGNAAHMDESSFKEMKYRLVGGAITARNRKAYAEMERQRRLEEEKRAARERAEQENTVKATVEWLEAIPLQDWENEDIDISNELAKRIRQISPIVNRRAEAEPIRNLAWRLYDRVLSFPVDWRHEDAVWQVSLKLGIVESTAQVLDPVLRDEGRTLNYAARIADLRDRLLTLKPGDSDEERQRWSGYEKLRNMLLEWLNPLYLKRRAVNSCRQKAPAERAAFLEKYAEAARLSPEEKRKLVAEVLAEMPKPTEPEKPVAN